ncbi:MAG: hypothetical protein U0136_05325 [Bdellovibrionota bacterium]
MANRIVVLLFCTVLVLLGTSTAGAQIAPSSLPLLRVEDLHYEGAFRLPTMSSRSPSQDSPSSAMEYNPARRSLYVVDGGSETAIAEVAIPPLSRSTLLSEMKVAAPTLQTFIETRPHLEKVGGHQSRRISGLSLLNRASGTELLVNTRVDDSGSSGNFPTTFVLRNADNLTQERTTEAFTFVSHASGSLGWISAVPSEWQQALGATHIMGQSNVARMNTGPGVVAFDSTAITTGAQLPSSVETATLLSFDTSHPLHPDLMNRSRTNDLWTYVSHAAYGFIPPGTSTCVTVGNSGGHRSGVCHSCRQTTTAVCRGYCPSDPSDSSPYFWLWDVNELLAVKAGQKKAYSLRPYAHGPFPTPLPTKEITSGTFDPALGLLYLTTDSVVLTYRLPGAQPDNRAPAPPSGVHLR